MNPSFLKKYEFCILSGQNGVCFDSFEYEYKLWYNTKVKRPLKKIKHAVAVLPSAYAGGGERNSICKAGVMGEKMKDYYTVGEISRLYGIGTDSLRYYEEIGALSPKRGKNNYRLYSLKDIYRLNIIRDLLTLGVSMKQIREYLDCQNMESTFRLLTWEMEKVQEQQRRLRQIERSIRERTCLLQECRNVEEGRIERKRYPRRNCLRLNVEIRRDEEMDYAVKKLQKRHEDKIRSLGERQIGASMSAEDVRGGIENVFYSVFILLEEDGAGEEFMELPEGDYLTVYYKGSYRNSGRWARRLLEEADRLGYETDENVLEWYPVDNRYTAEPSEFITRLEVGIKKQGQEHAYKRA